MNSRVLLRGAVVADGVGTTVQPADVNFFVSDADALFEEFSKKGAEMDEPPTNQKYGVRDFQVKDCNGYLLRFNQIL